MFFFGGGGSVRKIGKCNAAFLFLMQKFEKGD